MTDEREAGFREFDQTNGQAEGLEGDSDGSARGDLESKREQARADLDSHASNIIGGGPGRIS